MMNRLWHTFAVLICIAAFTMGAATDVTSSKNELLMRGSSPHLRFVDDGGNDYSLTVKGNVMRVFNIDSNALFNVPPTGSVGVELNAPTSPMVTPFTSGGSLADGSYFFVITALDGFGETIASSEVQCMVTGGGGSGRCVVSWATVNPPAQSYNVYMGTGSGLENHFTNVLAPTTTLNVTSSPLSTPGSPPSATTAYFIRLAPDGVHFSDGTIQSSAGGAAAWQIPPSTTNIVSAQSGNVGIGTGVSFVPDAKLTVLGVVDINDMGAIKALATNNVQFRSNYKNSTDRLWNTGQPSWSVVVGDGTDFFRIKRAPATAGAPSFATVFSIDSSGNVGIGSQNPASKLNLVGDGVDSEIFDDSYGTGFVSRLVGRHARGSFASPTAVQSGDVISSWAVRGYGTSFLTSNDAVIRAVATQTFTGSAHGTSLEFYTTPNGSISNILEAKLGEDGSFTLEGGGLVLGLAPAPSITFSDSLGDDWVAQTSTDNFLIRNVTTAKNLKIYPSGSILPGNLDSLPSAYVLCFDPAQNKVGYCTGAVSAGGICASCTSPVN